MDNNLKKEENDEYCLFNEINFRYKKRRTK